MAGMAKPSRLFLFLFVPPIAALSLTACAQNNVSGDTTGGSGGSATGGAGGTTTTSNGPCSSAEECAEFGDACNAGACINGECSKVPANDGAACDDGKGCTQDDHCEAGVCTSDTQKACPSSSPCMIGVCDTETDTCFEMPGNNGATCTINDPCALSASCINGSCQPKQLVDCSFLNDTCAVGICDSSAGCVKVVKDDGTPCNDFKFCTVQDQCVSGLCKGYPNTCNVALNDPCKIGVCNELQKTCNSVAGNDGAACDDGNLCTAGETCLSGGCAGGAPSNDGTACDDANGCTGGTTCAGGACSNPQSQITACVDGDMCCPAGCANDKDCLYWQSGVQSDVPESELVGWTECFQETYASYDSLSQVLQVQCTKAKLLLACRPVGAANFTVLAMAPRADVLFDCGSGYDCTHEANGVGWYYSDSWSWGFAPGGSPVQRDYCDIVDTFNFPGPATDGDQRLCWHTDFGSFYDGFRCGKSDYLYDTHERVIFQAD
jgi:hypothetical protein